MTTHAVSAFLDASDELAVVCDLLELLGMAHRNSPRSTDPEGSAVHAGTLAAIDHLEKAKALLEQIRPALGMPTMEEAMGKGRRQE